MTFNFSAVQLDRPPGPAHSDALNDAHPSPVRSRRVRFKAPAQPGFQQLQLQ
jgi:hypothetical protein